MKDSLEEGHLSRHEAGYFFVVVEGFILKLFFSLNSS